jgi:hypothetical protein
VRWSEFGCDVDLNLFACGRATRASAQRGKAEGLRRAGGSPLPNHELLLAPDFHCPRQILFSLFAQELGRALTQNGGTLDRNNS